LQRQVNALAKERVRTVRRLAERIGEGIAGIEEIHAHDTSEWHRADFSRWVGTIYDIRLKIYRKKFFIKFLNNFIAQLTPFFFYAIGGYLVIKGSLTFGALVAVLSAYKDLSSPWKELLDWYQQKEDTRVKYEQLVEQFRPRDMLPESLQQPEAGQVPHLSGAVIAANLTLEDEAGVKVVDQANFHFQIGDRVALLGNASSGGDAVAKMLARLLQPTSGSISIDGANLATLPEAVTGRRIAYVGNHVSLINGSVRDNLYYGLRNRPVPADEPLEEQARASHQRFVFEASKSGNTTSDPDGEWIDYATYDLDGPDALMERALGILRSVDLEADLFGLGLRGTVDPRDREVLSDRILAARRLLRERLKDRRYRGLVEVFDQDLYNKNMSVAENLLFGLPVDDTFDIERLSDHPYVQDVLEEVGLRGEFLAIGLRMAKIMVDLLGDLPPGHEFFERFSFIAADDLPEYRAAIRRIEDAGFAAAAPADRNALSSLPFRAIPARHRLGLFDEGTERRLLQARHLFARNLPPELRGSVAFFDAEAYNPAASVQDNILFGKLVYGRQQAQRQVGAMIAEVIDELGLRTEIVDLGLDFGVGVGGSRLTVAQRQKLAIARALLKRPDLLILDNATAALDAVGQAALREALFGRQAAGSLVWVTSDARQAAAFDGVIVLEAGRVLDQGAPDTVLARQAAIDQQGESEGESESEKMGGI
jgi:ABC-type multidrug transport system fused ATPase/permease subunit